MSENTVPVWGNELEYYINSGKDAEPVWTKATGLFIPVLPDPNGLFVASVKPDAASGG